MSGCTPTIPCVILYCAFYTFNLNLPLPYASFLTPHTMKILNKGFIPKECFMIRRVCKASCERVAVFGFAIMDVQQD